MIERITNIQHVVAFAKQLVAEEVNFHPDNDFKDYVNAETRQPTYSDEEANARNELMNQCFFVCERNGVDIYNLMGEVALTETSLGKLIPFPFGPFEE